MPTRSTRSSGRLGIQLDSFLVVSGRRMLCKLHSILDNNTHPLHQVLTSHRSTFSNSNHPFLGLNARGSPFCLWPSDSLIHLPQVERGLVETLRPEAKHQMSLYRMPIYNATSPNRLYVLFSLLMLLFAHRTYSTQLLMLFYVSIILSCLSILFYFISFHLVLSPLFHNCCTAISLGINKAS